MPIIDIVDERVALTGIALLRDAAYVGKMSLDETYPFSWMKQKRTETSYFKVRLKDHDEISIRNLKTKLRHHYSEASKEMTLYIRMTGKLMESNEAEPLDMTPAEMDKTMTNQLVKESEALVKKFQKLQIDPLGLGNYVRAHSRKWSEQKWKEQYSDIKIKVVIDSTIEK